MKRAVKNSASEVVNDVETADGLGVVRIEREHGESSTVVLEANRSVWSKGDLMGLVGELRRVARTL